MPAGAVRSGCGRAGTRKRPGAGPISSSSPRFPGWCRKRVWWKNLRRSQFRLKQIEHRLEVLGGYLVAYLNLDRVIKIIRNQDEPKPVLMKTFKLSDVQADAILNMRLRNLRKLEEIAIKKEDKDLRGEKKSLEDLVRADAQEWKTVSGEIKEVPARFGPKTALGKRRTSF